MNIRVMITAMLTAVIMAASITALAAETGTATLPPLTEEAIRKAFEPWGEGMGEQRDAWDYVNDPQEIKWERGSFTGPGAVEAVVSFNEERLPHFNAQLWLLKWDGKGWGPVFAILRSDTITFQAVDITGSGIDCLLVRMESSTTGGYRFMAWSLVSVLGGKDRTLYSAEGTGFWCYNEWEYNGHKEPMTDHELTLRDVNDDGVLELVDTELTGVFVSTGTDEGDCEIHNSPTKTTVYRFVLDRARKSPPWRRSKRGRTIDRMVHNPKEVRIMNRRMLGICHCERDPRGARRAGGPGLPRRKRHDHGG